MTKKAQPRSEPATAHIDKQRADLARFSAEISEEEWGRHVDAYHKGKSENPGAYAQTVAECRTIAKRLHQNFLDDNKLAPFECAAMWRRRRLPAVTLPGWVADALMYKVTARYFDRAIGCLAKPLPLPSMRRVAGLSGTRKRFTAWDRANRDSKAQAFSEAHQAIIDLAQAGIPPEVVAVLDPATGLPTKQLTRPGISKYVNDDGTFRGPDGDVPILDKQGHASIAFTTALAHLFHVSSPRDDNGRLDESRPPASDDAVYRAARRLLRRADK